MTLSFFCVYDAWREEYFVSPSSLIREVARFPNVETLVLQEFAGSFNKLVDDFASIESAIPWMVEALPKLRNLTISFGTLFGTGYSGSKKPLKSIFRKLASCVHSLQVITFTATCQNCLDHRGGSISCFHTQPGPRAYGFDSIWEAIWREFHLQFDVGDSIIISRRQECRWSGAESLDTDISVVLTKRS